jgi:hypothetical protein
MSNLRFVGLMFFDSTYENGVQHNLYTLLLLVSGLCSLAMIPLVTHEFDDWSEVLSISFSALTNAAAALGTVISSLIVFYNMKHKYKKYKITLESFQIYIPMDTDSWNRIKCFSYSSIIFSVIIIVPVNGLKLWNIFNNHEKPFLMTTFILLYYIQNLSSCFSELHFAIQCFVVHSNFRGINEELKILNVELNHKHNKKYSWTEYESPAVAVNDNNTMSSSVIVYEKDFYSSKQRGCPMANIVELLRIKHWLTREAVNDLNDLFGVTMGLSMMNILIVTLFDVYSEVLHAYTSGLEERTTFRSIAMFIIWMMQHFFRFLIIVVTAHNTTKQVNHFRLYKLLFSRNINILFRTKNE